MALFGFKKRKEDGGQVEHTDASREAVVKPRQEKEKKDRQTQPNEQVAASADVLLRPRITEKATLASSAGAYVFEVRTDATKGQVRDAIRSMYKVTPQKINIAKIPSKKIRQRAQRRFGVVSGGKKAYVYLKEGDTIEIV